MTPTTALRHQAEVRSEGTAFIMGTDVWSYARFAAEVDRLARGLVARGLRRGDRVALHLFNGPELAIAYHACFRIGAIAAPLNTRLKSAELDPLRSFILPGGSPKAAALHVARTVCRRAERHVVRLQHEVELPPLAVIYLNRLSDLLFTLARLANRRAGTGEVTW